jgi:hypothetical protein
MLRHVGLLGMSMGKHVETPHFCEVMEFLSCYQNSKTDNSKKEGNIIEVPLVKILVKKVWLIKGKTLSVF